MAGKQIRLLLAAALAAAVALAREETAADGASAKDAAWAAGENVSFEGSDLIGKLGYDAEGKVLRVQMVHSSDWYLYQDVPAEVAEKFYRSASKGGYFGAHVKGRYKFVRQE